MNSGDYELMRSEIHSVSAVIEAMAIELDDHRPILSKRLLIVGYGSNLNAAKVLERVLAARGIGLRFATPHRAVLLEGETLVCITRSAASDDVLAFLEANKAQHDCILLTANVESDNAVRLAQEASVQVVHLALARSRPTVATQSIFAIIMALDCLLSTESRTALWRDFALHLNQRLETMHEVARRRAGLASLAQRLFIVGDDIMEDVAVSLALTIMETSQLTCVPLPLGAGTKGPIMHFGETDGVLLLGEDPDGLFSRYRSSAGYSLHLSMPADAQEIAQALYTLITGQLLALELSRLR